MKKVGSVLLVVGFLASAATTFSQTINVEIQTYSDGVEYVGNDGVLSGSGTFWNNLNYEVPGNNLKYESGAASAVDIVQLQGTDLEDTFNGTKIFRGNKIYLCADSPELIYGIRDLDPYKTYDIVMYYGLASGAAKGVATVYGDGEPTNKLCSGSSDNTLPGTEGVTYLRFNGVRPYEVATNQYGIQVNASKDSSLTADQAFLAGIQIKDTGTRANIPPHFPAASTPTNGATGIGLVPALTASAFSDPDVGDTHANSRWQVDDDSDFSSPEWDSGDAYAATTSAIVQGVLASATKYYWHVRYKDSAGNWSPYSSPFSFTTVAPEMDVQGNSTSITDGDTTPSSADHTDFGSALVAGGTVVRTFTVLNTSAAAALNLTGVPKVTVGGTHWMDFTVIAQPSTPVGLGASTTFQVRFDPAAIGLRSATLSIANDDLDENPYTFSIQGTGTAPEMDVQGNSASITDGDSTPSLADYTDFGSTLTAGGTVVRTFTVRNTGSGALNLTGSPRVLVYGAHAVDFTVTMQPSTPVAAAGTTTFQITFNPSAAGIRSAILSMVNDDADENPYNFSIQGTGTAPEIDVQGNSTSITDGDSTPSLTDHTDFGSALAAGGTVARTFTVRNTGTATLNLTGGPRVAVSGTHAAEFTVTLYPAGTVAAAGTTTFQVTFDPADAGTRSATLSIDNTDTDENPYTFAVQGTGIIPLEMQAPEMGSGEIAVIRWSSIAEHVYTVHHSTNLLTGFSVLQANIPATPPINVYTDSVNGASAKFWKVSTNE